MLGCFYKASPGKLVQMRSGGLDKSCLHHVLLRDSIFWWKVKVDDIDSLVYILFI